MPLTGKIKNLFEDKDMTISVFPRTKVKAVSDDNGVGLDAILNTVVYSEEYNGDVATIGVSADALGGIPASEYVDKSKIANNLTTEEEGFVADARALKVLNDSKLSMELLWQNASPDSDFAAQTISVNGEKYTRFFVDFNMTTTLTNGFSSVVFQGKTNICCNAATYQGKAGGYIHRRDVTVSADKKSISFSNGYRQLGETEETNKANVAVPMAIYGF